MGGPEGIERQRKRGKLTVRERIDALADEGTFQEIGGLAGGAKYVGEKLTSFTPGMWPRAPSNLSSTTNTFHLPMVCFADEPGVMVGLEAQRQGIVRAGAKIVCATQQSRMPWITFVIRQLYGVAGQCYDRAMRGMFKRVAWPSANWGSMHIEGGASAAYRREIDASGDPEAKREELERRLQAFASPLRTAEAFNIEDIIDPRETRPVLCEFIEMAQPMLKTQLGPTSGPSYQP
jgi:acetyl-CoA carboxylase carboxyltransferase component